MDRWEDEYRYSLVIGDADVAMVGGLDFVEMARFASRIVFNSEGMLPHLTVWDGETEAVTLCCHGSITVNNAGLKLHQYGEHEYIGASMRDAVRRQKRGIAS